MTRAAYLIGVPEYDAAEFKDLLAVRNDVARMAGALKSSGYDVHTHPDNPVALGRNKIMAAIRKVARDATADLLLIYFSGHGVHFDGVDYLVPHDAPGDDDDLSEFLISWDSLKNALDDAKASTILLVADVCREAIQAKGIADEKSLAPFSNVKAERVKNRNVIRIYSCAPADLSWMARGPDGLSHFTEAFAEAMDASSSPRLPQDVLKYAQERLDSICAKNKHPRQEIRYDSPGGLSVHGLPGIEIAHGTGTASSAVIALPERSPQETLPALDFSELIATYIKNFVGREWLLEKIDAFLTSEDRYLIITGESGIGKSAVAAALTKTRTIHAHHFCRARQAETFNPDTFVRSMSGQLSKALNGFRPEIEKADEAKTVYELLEHLLIAPLKAWMKTHPAESVTLLVDSLDEAETHPQPNILDLLRVTTGMPSGVRWVLTSRPHSRANALPGTRETILDSAPNNRQDIRKLIDSTLANEPLVSLIDSAPEKREALADALARNSGGNFRYLVLVLAQLESDARQGRLPEPERLPRGLTEAYRDFLDRAVGLHFEDVWERKFFPVLQVLAVALDPLTFEQVSALSGISKGPANQALIALDQFLDPTDGGPRLYRIFHASFTDFLTDREAAGTYWIDPEQAHSRIADHYWPPQGGDWSRSDAYGLRCLPSHLAAAGREDDLTSLLFDYCYLRIRIERGELIELLDAFALTDDSEASLLAGALRLSGHVLRHNSQELPTQLLGRIPSNEARTKFEQNQPAKPINKLLLCMATYMVQPWLRPLYPCLALSDGPLRLVLEGHSGHVTCVAIMPNGQRIISGSEDNTIRLWDLYTGSCVCSLEGHTNMITSLAVTPDGWLLASGAYDRTIRIWDLNTGLCIRILEGHTDIVASLIMTSDGRILVSASADNTIRLWDLNSGLCVCTLVGHTNMVTSLAVTPDGNFLVSGAYDDTIRIWDLTTSSRPKLLASHGSVSGITITPDGHQIVSGSLDKTIRIWDLRTGSCLHTLKGHTRSVNSVVVTSDGLLVSGSNDETIRVWDLASGSCLNTLDGHQSAVTSLDATPDGHLLVSGSYDETIRVWDLASSCRPNVQARHADLVAGIAVTPDGRQIVSGSWDKTIRIWDLSNGSCLHTLVGHTLMVTSVAVTSDGKYIVSGSWDNTIRVWDLESCVYLSTLNGHTSIVTSVGVTSDGKYIVSGSWDNTIRVWDLHSGSCMNTLEGHTNSVTCIVVPVDGQCVVSGSADGTICIWDLNTGSCIRTLRGHTGLVANLAVTSDNRCIVSSSSDDTIRVWDLHTGACMRTLEGQTNGVLSVASMLNSQCFVSGSSDKVIRVRNIADGMPIAAVTIDAPVHSCAAGSNGVVVAGDQYGRVIAFRLENAV